MKKERKKDMNKMTIWAEAKNNNCTNLIWRDRYDNRHKISMEFVKGNLQFVYDCRDMKNMRFYYSDYNLLWWFE